VADHSTSADWIILPQTLTNIEIEERRQYLLNHDRVAKQVGWIKSALCNRLIEITGHRLQNNAGGHDLAQSLNQLNCCPLFPYAAMAILSTLYGKEESQAWG